MRISDAFYCGGSLPFEKQSLTLSQNIFLSYMTNFNHKLLRRFVTFICAAILWSCGDSESFTIEGTVDGNATLNLRFIYYSNNTLVRGLTAARDGKFEYKGVAPTPTIVEILDNDYRPLGRLFVVNGDHIECSLTRNAPNAIKVSGSEVSERWADFLNDNAEGLNSPTANNVIEKYVSDHPDDIVSTLLMLTSYNASSNALKADSLMSSINPDVRPSTIVAGFNTLLQRLVSDSATEPITGITCLNMKDSLVKVDPEARPLSLIILSDNASGRQDSIVSALKRLSGKSKKKSLQIIDISLDKDTVAWHKSVRPDSADWHQLWVAGSLASPGLERLGVPTVPYFIITDSTGVQLLRTVSIKRAEAYADSCINAN